jgi:hypothetical protein
VIFIPLTVVRVGVTVGLKEHFFRMAEQLQGPFEKFMYSPYYSVNVFKKWVERCKKCIACQGKYFEKETVTAPPLSSDSE